MKQRPFLITAFSLLILILLIGSLALIIKELGKPQFTAPRAAAGEAPKNIRRTNLTENSVTVSWITDDQVAGIVRYGTDPARPDKTATEDDGRVPSAVHHITLKPLKPAATYYFRLQSGQSVFDDSGQPFTIATPKVISTPPPPQTIYGSILSAVGASLTDKAIVYVDIPNSSTPLSALVNPDSGNWSLSISTVRAAGQDHYLAVADDTILKIFVQAASQGTSTATVKVSNASPISPISLNQTYTFDETISATGRSASGGSNQQLTISNSSSTFTIKPNLTPIKPNLTPTEINLAVTNITEGQKLTDLSPTFSGTAPPAAKIKITLQSPTVYTADITVKPDGAWEWTPPADLAPGSHTITISYTDNTGQTHTESKTFLVQSSSASVTPIPTISEQQLPAAGTALPSIILVLMGIITLSLGISLSSKSSLPASS